ncbi:MAG: HPr family phosphocarrier protein [Lachnospiraceae bacterium]|nr:HPr family phosphocarrier protein [Lachnospiraceae bacterium]
MERKNIRIGEALTLDGRQIAQAVQLADSFESALHLLQDNARINLKSIMGMMTVQLKAGDEITLTAEGKDEKEAVARLSEFFGKTS